MIYRYWSGVLRGYRLDWGIYLRASGFCFLVVIAGAAALVWSSGVRW